MDYYKLIVSALEVAETHLRNNLKARLAIEWTLAKSVVRNTKGTPVYGLRATQWQPSPSQSSAHTRRNSVPKPKPRQYPAPQSAPEPNPQKFGGGEKFLVPRQQTDLQPVARSTPNSPKTEMQLLQEFQNLHELLLVTKAVPKSQIPKILEALSKNPLVSVRGLAGAAEISVATAYRWLTNLADQGVLVILGNNGMNQYACKSLLDILDRYVRARLFESRNRS